MRYPYTGFHGCDSTCNLEIIKNLVIATEIPENEGTSITNMAEHLATRICQEFNIEPSHLIWIEHYAERGDYPESYDLVQFNLDGSGTFFKGKAFFPTPAGRVSQKPSSKPSEQRTPHKPFTTKGAAIHPRALPLTTISIDNPINNML